MRKHFLILMLLTLLPLAGWAKINLSTNCQLVWGTGSRTFVYTGENPDLQLTLRENGMTTPVSTSHYDLVFYSDDGGTTEINFGTDVVDANVYYVRAKAKGSSSMYEGQTDIQPFEITPVDINTLEASYAGNPFEWDNTAKTPLANTFTVTFNGGDLIAGTDFVLDGTTPYTNNSNVGRAKANLVGQGNFTGTKAVPFDINPKAQLPTAASVTITDPTYTGYTAIPVVEIVDNNVNPAYTLVQGTDFEVSSSASAAGTATLTITAKDGGNYAATADAVTKDFTIQKANIADATIDWTDVTDAITAATNKVYNGAAGVQIAGMLAGNTAATDEIQPTLTTASGNYTLQKGVDYEITYTDNVAISTNVTKAKITFTGKGNFDATTSKTHEFVIAKRPLTINVEDYARSIGTDFAPEVTVDNFADDADKASFNTAGSINVAYAQGGNAKNPATDGEGVYDVTVTLTWANNNYDVANAIANCQLTVNKGQVVLKLKDQTIVYNENPQPFHFEHVRGLTDEQAADLDNLVGTAALVYTSYDATKMVNANTEGYVVNFTGDIANSDYTFTVNPGKLIINRKDLRQGLNMVTTVEDATYAGKAVAPVVTIKDNGVDVPASEYSVVYDTDYNVGTNHKAKISATEGGNYCVTEWNEIISSTVTTKRTDYDANYKITRAPLTITADDFLELTYGQTKEDYNATVEDLVGNDKDKDLQAAIQAGFEGKLIVKNTSNGNVGEHTGALKPYFVKANGDEVALDLVTPANNDNLSTNYRITAIAGKLKVSPAEIIVKVKEARLGYGVQPIENNATAANNTFKLEYVSGLPTEEVAQFESIVNYSTTAADYGYNAISMATINETEGYDLTYTGTATATNYTVKFLNDSKAGKLYVTKRPVRFAVKAGLQKVYSEVPAFVATISDLAALETAGNLNDYIEQTIGEEQGVTYYDLLPNHKVTDLIESLTLENNLIGENALTLAAKTGTIADNYEITLVDGILTITKDAGVTLITLKRVEKDDFADAAKNTAAALIHNNNGEVRDVQFTFPAQTMYANKWYSMVLPFATSVKQISEAFGYALVDIFNTNSNDANDVSFKVHMGDIEANQPFIVKIYKDIKADDENATYPGLLTGVKFENVQIEESNNTTLEDAYGNQYVGLYSGKLGGFKVEYDWTYGLGKDATTYQPIDNANFFIRPLGAYVHFKDPQEHNARTITIEELGGETTVIQINSDATDDAKGWYNMNGVKMNAAPAQKGVYIHNGKKVVIK